MFLPSHFQFLLKAQWPLVRGTLLVMSMANSDQVCSLQQSCKPLELEARAGAASDRVSAFRGSANFHSFVRTCCGGLPYRRVYVYVQY